MTPDFFNTGNTNSSGFGPTIRDTEKLTDEFERLREKGTALLNGLKHLRSEMMDFNSANKVFTDLSKAVNSFFKSLTEGKAAPFNQFIKSVVSTFLTSIQAMLLGAEGAAAAKGITTFGLSLITDLPAIAGAWLALEAAKGIIAGLAGGGTAQAGVPYIVGEHGPELFIPGSSGSVMTNRELRQMINANVVSQNKSPVVNNYYRIDVNKGMLYKEGKNEYTKYKKAVSR
jgi:phage-related minor tail protein